MYDLWVCEECGLAYPAEKYLISATQTSATQGNSLATKSEKLFAAYARFAQAVSGIPDLKARELSVIADGVPAFVAEVGAQGVKQTSSQIVSGLEQGLREMPALIDEVDIHWRAAVSKALHDAVAAEYPEFLRIETARLEKVVVRGKIKTKAEFHLVRHRIDVLEGEPELPAELRRLYALAGAFEAGG